ncbi:restriction endonuclease subunit S [Chryseobacterium foetidum]|uniref:restriction endonuclease subunit S n=1 Tax=Chryseobacterium foetidum TaxID=2951057 RepID=UPI0021CA3090|nr:restriction endonuclease subunit S [Chryseobacterium foetidum]
MMEGWKEVKLGEICNVINGFAFKSKDFVREGIPLVKIKELKDKRININHCDYLPTDFIVNEKFKVNKGDVLIALTGSHITLPSSAVGRVCKSLIDKTLFLNQRVGRFVAFEDKCDLNFLYFFLTSEDFFNNVGLLATGAANQANISGEDVKTISINLPPLETQRKIANILSGYDDLIENNQKRIKILEEMAQQTYEEWFVRMRFPGYETAIFDENGLPKDWKTMKLGEFLDFKKGKKIEEFLEVNEQGTEKVLLLDSIESGNFKYTKIGKHELVKRGDILMLMDGARSSYVFQADNGIIGSTLAKIETKKIPASFMFFYFQNNLEWLQINNTGAAIPHANPKFIKSINFKLPNEKLFVDWQSFTEPILNNIWNLKDQNQSLREARDILLPRLMMGMIDVSESSEQVGSVESKPSDAKVIPLEQPKKEASKEFKEAVLIACLTERFGSEKFPLGRKRYTKLSYLFHRYSDNKIQDYLRKAAGPYNPKTKYGGPEKIALNNKYIQNWKSNNKMTGFVSAEKIEDAKTYFSNYWQISDLDWLTKEFKFKSNDELELLATVDNSLVELSKKNLEFTSANVLDIIKSEKEWEAKLERTIFSDSNVERAIGFLRGVLEYNQSLENGRINI